MLYWEINVQFNENVLHTFFPRAKEKPQKLRKKMSNLRRSTGSVRRLDVRLYIQFVLQVHLKGGAFDYVIKKEPSLFI